MIAIGSCALVSVVAVDVEMNGSVPMRHVDVCHCRMGSHDAPTSHVPRYYQKPCAKTTGCIRAFHRFTSTSAHANCRQPSQSLCKPLHPRFITTHSFDSFSLHAAFTLQTSRWQFTQITQVWWPKSSSMITRSKNTKIMKGRVRTQRPSTWRLKLASTSQFVTLFQRHSSLPTASRPSSNLMALICANRFWIAIITEMV
jgi:hypothetical protein